MNTLTTISGSLWNSAVTTGAGRLFLLSAFLLLLGLVVEIWCEGRGLRSLSRVPIRDLEHRHPHVPALFTVAQILVTSLNLFIVSLLLLRGFGFLPDTRSWMVFATIFLALLTAAVLAELHWKGAALASFAFSTGTTVVFLWILFKSGLVAYSALLAAGLVVLLAISACALVALARQGRHRTALPLFLLTIVFWLIIAAFLT